MPGRRLAAWRRGFAGPPWLRRDLTTKGQTPSDPISVRFAGTRRGWCEPAEATSNSQETSAGHPPSSLPHLHAVSCSTDFSDFRPFLVL